MYDDSDRGDRYRTQLLQVHEKTPMAVSKHSFDFFKYFHRKD